MSAYVKYHVLNMSFNIEVNRVYSLKGIRNKITILYEIILKGYRKAI